MEKKYAPKFGNSQGPVCTVCSFLPQADILAMQRINKRYHRTLIPRYRPTYKVYFTFP